MKIYEQYGFNEFILALGYKGTAIKKYFQKSNLENLNKQYNKYAGIKIKSKKWDIKFCFSGLRTMTGGRLLRLKKYLNKEQSFMLTYGDGLSNVNIKKLIKFHNLHKKDATVTAVIPSPRFGGLKLKGNLVKNFKEKPQAGEGWINGGFFVFNQKVFKYLKNDKTILERKPLESLSREKLVAFEIKKLLAMHGYQKRPRIVRKIMEKKEIKMVNKIDYLKKRYDFF